MLKKKQYLQSKSENQIQPSLLKTYVAGILLLLINLVIYLLMWIADISVISFQKFHTRQKFPKASHTHTSFRNTIID